MAGKHIHLIGICGTAMASLAGMLQTVGHRVTGSDAAAYPPMSDQLAAWGIQVFGSYDAANLTVRPELVVVGNAISRGNPEVEFVLDERIPFTSMAALLHDEFLRGRESFVVAGTHGKTHAGLDLSGCGTGAIVSDRWSGGKLWDELHGEVYEAFYSGGR